MRKIWTNWTYGIKRKGPTGIPPVGPMAFSVACLYIIPVDIRFGALKPYLQFPSGPTPLGMYK